MTGGDLQLSKSEQAKLEKLLLEFEQSWSPEALDDVAADLLLETADFSRIAVVELVKIDIHRHWAAGNGRQIESYQSLLSEHLQSELIPTELILAESLARIDSGQQCSGSEFRQRFPDQFEEFKKLFDAERARRSGHSRIQASISTDAGKSLTETQQVRKPARASSEQSLPENFGRYRIIRQLGAGAMGAVYLAHDTQLDRQVALKTPSFGNSANEDLIERFYREARAAGNLRNSNICPIFDVGEIDGHHYLTMAFINGRPLSEFIDEDRSLDQKAVAGIVRRIALGLEHAHAEGVIHRDLKPANIMVDQQKQPIVMDFGLARRDDEMQSRMTQSGMILGTPAYMSPEQVQGQIDEVGPTADVYSLGVILYELLTGKLPFEGSVAAVIGQILTKEPEPPRGIRPDIDPPLEAIALKMIAKDQSQRYQSMKAAAADLGTYIKGGQTLAEPAVEPVVPQVDPIPLPTPGRSTQPSLAEPSADRWQAGKKTSPSFWKSRGGLITLIGGSAAALILLASIAVIVFRTPYGTLTIETDDPNLVVEVDGLQINIRDTSPIRFQDGSHDLGIRVGNQRLLIGEQEPFQIVGRDGNYQLSAQVGDTQLISGQFTIDRGKNTVLRISLSPVGSADNENPSATRASASTVPRTPLPDGPAGPVLTLTGHTRGICGLRFTHDGGRLVSNAVDKTIRVWDLPGGTESQTISIGHAGRDLASSPVGPFAASCGVAGDVGIYDLQTGQKLRPLKSEFKGGGLFMGIDYSPDGSQVAAVSLDGKGRVWEAATGRFLFDFPIATRQDTDCNVQFTPDGQHMIVGAATTPPMLQIFSTVNGHSAGSISLEPNSRSARFSISPDGNHIAAVVPNGVTVYDFAQRSKAKSKRLPGSLNIAYSPDGRWLAIVHRDGTISILDANSLEVRQVFEHTSSFYIALHFSPDSRFLATAVGGWAGKVQGPFDIRVWRVEGNATDNSTARSSPANNTGTTSKTTQPRATRPLQPAYESTGHNGAISDLALLPRSQRIASASADHSVRLWDGPTGDQVAEFTDHASVVWRIAVSPIDESVLAICYDDSTVVLRDIEDHKTIAKWNTEQKNTIDVTFSNDGKWLATAGDDGTAKLWHVATQKLIRKIQAHPTRATVVRFTPDDQHLITGGKQGGARVWRVKDGVKIAEYTGHDTTLRMVFCSDVSSDGKLAVSAGNDGNVHLWQTTTGSAVHVMRGHRDAVVSVQFSDDGRRIVSGSFDGTFRIWDVDSGALQNEGSAKNNGCNIAIFGPDTESVITAGGIDTNWKPVGSYVIRKWILAGTAARPEYLDIATGKWISHFDELVQQVDGKTLITSNDELEMKDGYGWFLGDKSSRNAIVRASIRKFKHGGDREKPYLVLRRPPGSNAADEGKATNYKTYLKGWNRIGVSKHTKDKGWVTLAEKDVGRKLDEYFEWTFAMIEDQIKVYVDGVLLISISDSESIEKGIPFFSTSGLARIKNIEVMTLDGNRVVADANGWIDVIPLIDPLRDRLATSATGANWWRKADDQLYFDRDDKSGKILLPLIVDGPSVEWEFEFTRRNGGAFLNVDVPAKKGVVPVEFNTASDPDKVFVFGGAPDGGRFTFDERAKIENGQRMKARVQIRKEADGDRIEVFVGGQSLGVWTGNREAIAKEIEESFDFTKRIGFFVRGRGSDFVFHSIRLRMIDGTAKLLDGTVVSKVDGLTGRESVEPDTEEKPRADREPRAGNNGWISLFNGRDLDGWVQYQTGKPVRGWVVEGGAMHLPESGNGGAIMTAEMFADFELRFDWMISVGGNSGVFYRAPGNDPSPQKSALEYQILDDNRFPDVNARQLAAGIYNIVAPTTARPRKKLGDKWQTGRIIARGKHVEHWLNGQKVAEIEIGGRQWKQALRKTKVNEPPDFGQLTEGHIVFQDHGKPVWFRDMRIRRLDTDSPSDDAGDVSRNEPNRPPPANDILKTLGSGQMTVTGDWSAEDFGWELKKWTEPGSASLGQAGRQNYRLQAEIAWLPISRTPEMKPILGSGLPNQWNFGVNNLPLRGVMKKFFERDRTKPANQVRYQFDFDETELKKSGVDLDQPITVSIKNAKSVQEGHELFFRSAFDQVGLEFQRTAASRISLKPKKGPALSVGLKLPVGDRHATLWISPGMADSSGLSLKSGERVILDDDMINAIDIFGSKPQQIEARVSVDNDRVSISATLNENTLVEWTGSLDELESRGRGEASLTIGGWKSVRFQIRSLTFDEL